MRTLSLAFAALLITVAACDLAGPGEVDPPRELTVQEQQIADASGDFGLKLFRAVSEAEDEEANLFLSPLSVSMALGMTLNGAEGETRAEMEQALELAGLSRAEINQSYESLIRLLTEMDPQVTMKIANSIWHRDNFHVEQDFIDTNREHFDAEVAGLDFSDPEAPDIINAWVKNNTNGLIEEIVEAPIDAWVVMYLINAIYFQGDWTYQFDPSATEPEPFYLEDGSEVEVDMMKLDEAALPYYRDEELTAVDLPYGNKYYSMTLLLPHQDQDLETLIQDLDTARWEEVSHGLQEREIFVRLPRFELEYEKELTEVLKTLGMERAFDSGLSDFSGINSERGEELYVSEVMHKSFVSVDEEGTEAAAATSVEVKLISMPPTVRFNRPFAFLIRDHHSGSIVFAGTVGDPTAG